MLIWKNKPTQAVCTPQTANFFKLFTVCTCMFQYLCLSCEGIEILTKI